MLLDNLGKSNEEDMSFIAATKSKDYVQRLNQAAPYKEEAPLHQLLNIKNSTLRDILRPMVEINPYFRPSARELLKADYFDDVRIPEFEKSCTTKMSLEIDHDQFKDPDS